MLDQKKANEFRLPSGQPGTHNNNRSGKMSIREQANTLGTKGLQGRGGTGWASGEVARKAGMDRRRP